MRATNSVLALGLAMLVMASSGLAVAEDSEAEKPVTITFYHTADLHENGAGLSRIAGFVESRRDEDPNVLFVDSGDWFNKGDLTPLETRGEAMAAMLGASDYDAVIPGNNEHTFGTARLAELIDRFSLPFVASNLVWPEGMEPEHAEPYRLFELDGVTVAIIGTATPHPSRTWPWTERDELLEFQSIEESARDVVAILEERADIIVLLTHLGKWKDRQLAEALPGIDIIFGGHVHSRFPKVMVADGTGTIFQHSGCCGRWVGHLTVVWDGERIVEPEWRVLGVTDELPKAEAVAAIYREYMAQAPTITDPVQIIVAQRDCVAGDPVVPVRRTVSAAEVGPGVYTNIYHVAGRIAAVDIPRGTPITPDLLDPAE